MRTTKKKAGWVRCGVLIVIEAIVLCVMSLISLGGGGLIAINAIVFAVMAVSSLFGARKFSCI